MTLVEHDSSDFEVAGEAFPGGVPERQWHHHVEDSELYQGHPKYFRGHSRSSPPPRCKSPLPTGTPEIPFFGLISAQVAWNWPVYYTNPVMNRPKKMRILHLFILRNHIRYVGLK